MQKATPRHAIVFALFLTFYFTSRSLAVAVPPTINVAAGESIQKAIDTAPDGATLNIAAGTFPEHLVISKPLTLIGAGPDKTILKPNQRRAYADREERVLQEARRRQNPCRTHAPCDGNRRRRANPDD